MTNENTLLQTLGFDVAIDHPHTHVVRCCQLVKASKELAQASYYLATNSLHLTTMCLRYSPTIVACFCIHLACKWSNYKIPLSAQNKEWYVYVDPAANNDILEELTEEFLTVYDQCPSRLKKKIKASTQAVSFDKPYLLVWAWTEILVALFQRIFSHTEVAINSSSILLSPTDLLLTHNIFGAV